MSVLANRFFLNSFYPGLLILMINFSRMRIVIQDNCAIRVIRINTMRRLSDEGPSLPSTIQGVILRRI